MIRRLSAGAAAVMVAALAAIAWASWTTPASAGSKGGAAAATVNQGATPSVSVTAIGREVSVSWGAATLSNGAPVGGYLVSRYPSAGGSAAMSTVGSCTGTVVATSCVEDDVPGGTWRYTVTPVLGGWHGAESLTSGVVSVAASALIVNGSPFGNAAFTPLTANATGSISGFSGTGTGGHGEGVSYRLDSSTPLVGVPVFVGTDGSASITALAIPKSAGDGAHTVYALGDASYSPSQASAGIVIDTAAPAVSAQLSPSPNGAGWNNGSPVSVSLSADDGTGSGVSQIKYTTDGSDPTTSGTAQVYSGSPFNVAAEGATTVKYFATDVAGNASAVESQAVKIDTTAPTGGALTVNGTAASGAGTSSYNSSGSFTISAITDYTDAGSGLASSTLTRQAATLSAGSCGSYGAPTTIASRLTPIVQTLSGPSCYLYTLTGTDNVGNTVAISTTVKVDTSAPSAPAITLAGASGNTYLSGTTAYINAQAGKSGSFQASATSSDGDSGILKLNFPSLSGFSAGGGDVSSSPYQTTYSWSGAVGASGSQTVTAYNNANLTATASFTVTPDTTAPTGGALTVDGTAASGAGTTSTTSNPSFTIGSRTDYTDSGSGLASSTLTIQSETLTSNATCGAAGSGGPYTSATTISGTTNPAITVGYCYLYTLTGTDNVGNAVSVSTTVKAPFAGIDWTNITTSNNRTVSCNYTTITAVTCTVSGVGSGGTFTANVRLIDANHNTVANSTGSTITVSQTTTGQGTGAPASTTIAQNASSSAGTFTLTLNNGGSKTATITASITVNSVTYTVNCQVST
jgi:Chitobiase/beta-hexosaminidase C-terminal domain